MEEMDVGEIAVIENDHGLHPDTTCVETHVKVGEDLTSANAGLTLAEDCSTLQGSPDGLSVLFPTGSDVPQSVEVETVCHESVLDGDAEGSTNKPVFLTDQTVIHVVTDEDGNVRTLENPSDIQLVVDMEGQHIVLCTSDGKNVMTAEENTGELEIAHLSKTAKEPGGDETLESLEAKELKTAASSQVFDTSVSEKMGSTNEKPFVCDLCSATFTRLGNFTRHRMIHTIHVKDDYRYKCDVCERMFLQRCDLKRHMLVHQGNQPFKCDTCGKGYIRKSDLVVHRRFHNNERSFPCSQCTKAFYQSGDLLRHQRLVHRRESLLTCGHCKRKYSKEATLIRHMQTAHRDLILGSLGDKGPDLNGTQAGDKNIISTELMNISNEIKISVKSPLFPQVQLNDT